MFKRRKNVEHVLSMQKDNNNKICNTLKAIYISAKNKKTKKINIEG